MAVEIHKPSTLDERLAALILEADDCSGARFMVERRPLLDHDAQLSEFEDDLRDWGFVYGVAFGLARCEEPCETAESVARRAFAAAVGVHTRWTGDFAPRDGGVRAAKKLVRALDQAEAASETGRPLMTDALVEALGEFEVAAGAA